MNSDHGNSVLDLCSSSAQTACVNHGDVLVSLQRRCIWRFYAAQESNYLLRIDLACTTDIRLPEIDVSSPKADKIVSHIPAMVGRENNTSNWLRYRTTQWTLHVDPPQAYAQVHNSQSHSVCGDGRWQPTTGKYLSLRLPFNSCCVVNCW